MTKKEDAVYVGIEGAVDVRRALLESSKSFVHLLKQQQSVKQLRASKHKLVEDLRTLLAKINELIAQAKQLMPEIDAASLPAEEEKEEKKKVKKTAKTAKAMTLPKQKKPQPAQSALPASVESHVDKFEKELLEIEKKLQSL